MKKIFLLIIIVLIGYIGYNHFKNNNQEENKFIYADILDNTKEEIYVTKFTIYGKYLNFEGALPKNIKEASLVFKNNDTELPFKILIDEEKFKTNLYINEGINLEKVNIGKYVILLKDSNDNYYTLVNKTDYHDNSYWTMTKKEKNNLVTFKESNYNDKNYWLISVEEKDLPNDVYDIVIDPGHGGIDTGAGNGRYNESKYTLEYAKILRDVLEEEGLKVKLTREDDVLIDHYGEGSRTGIPYEVKAKLMLSIHLNSSNSSIQRGVEIYKAYNDNNTFAKVLADNINKEVKIPYSNNPMHKVINGVYMRVYSKSDINELINEAKRDKYTPYDYKDNITYYYFIRETGGIITGAFSDGRNPKYKENLYRNYNQGIEAYLCELAYISQKDDLSLILNKKDDFIKALKNSVLYYVNDKLDSEVS